MKQIQIAVIGASRAKDDHYSLAEELGRGIAANGWILLNGGLSGVMEASAKGAFEAGGTVVGILPTANAADANPYVSIPIVTNMGHARNVVLVQSADVCVAVGGKEGTLSEIAIALKIGKVVIGLDSWDVPGVQSVQSVDEVLQILKEQV